jgi:hypothetical protein
MKYIQSIVYSIVLILSLWSCNKRVELSRENLIKQDLVDKFWYLETKTTGTTTQSFARQATSYFITFSKNNTTIDSDGLQGTYSIVFVNDKYQLNVIAKTINGNSINYTNTLVLVNPTTMIQSYTMTGQAESTLLYFSAK